MRVVVRTVGNSFLYMMYDYWEAETKHDYEKMPEGQLSVCTELNSSRSRQFHLVRSNIKEWS